MKFWIKTSFWDRVIKTLALFGTPAGMGAGYLQANPTYLIIGGVCAMLSAALAIWFTDADKNGIIDLFEDEEK